MQVTLTGSGFGVAQGSGLVSFGNGAYGSVVSWGDTQIVATVPAANLTPGNMTVRQNGVWSNGVAFTVIAPILSSISPTALSPGMQVTLTGSGFGVAQGSGLVSFGNGAYGSVVSWGDTQIVATVPAANLTPGNMTVRQNGVWSNGVAFTVIAPILSSISPTALSPGMQVTLTGSGFGVAQGSGLVSFGNGAYGSVVSWGDTQIVATVPAANLTPGNMTVRQNGVWSNGVAFTVIAPILSSISPTALSPGMQVTLTGSGFGVAQGSGLVYFGNGAYGSVVSWGNTQIVATVPASNLTPGNMTVRQNGVWSNAKPFTILPPPTITSLSPTTGAVGASTTITGTNFGALQSNSSVTFNGTVATPTSWSATSIAVPVPSGASTGNVVVTVGTAASNGVSFTVLAPPSITSVSPTSGVVGTSITITGTGFGSTQGSGTVWLGSTYGVVTAWSDTQVVATVAAGSTTGTAKIMQGGVWSNAVDFTLISPQVSSVTPTSALVGGQVTITGSGFGATQGSGNVWLGSAYGVVTSWSDTQIVATVAAGSQTGSAKILQYGVWSNAVNFTVETLPPPTGVILTPSAASMVVGETRTFQAADTQGQPFQGLMWSSSDPTVASLSTDDPPVITALVPGHTTITAADGSAEITVYAGPILPTGTIKWSIPGDGSGVTQILPAVPSETGVADVFALQSSGKLMAVTADGFVSWTAEVGIGKTLLPDFQGGMVLADQQSVQKLDGLTGQARPAYSYSNPYATVPTVVHTDGTIFTVDGSLVVGINPQTGVPKFSVSMEQSVGSSNGNCGEYTPSEGSSPPDVGRAIIAGDGYLYLPYFYTLRPLASNQKICNGFSGELITSHFEVHSRVLRVGTDGSSTEISIGDWATDSTSECVPGPPFGGGAECFYGYWVYTQSGAVPTSSLLGTLITNADQGALYAWQLGFATTPPSSPITQLTPISAGGAGTAASMTGYVEPVLQQQDGTFVGVLYDDQQNLTQLISFDQAGNMKWSATGDYQPQIATADGGVIAQNWDTGTSVTFDNTGSVTGQLGSLSTRSWVGSAYSASQGSSLLSQVGPPVSYAPTFAAIQGGNHSGTGTFVHQEWFPELPSCPLAPPGQPPCAKEAIRDALQALRAKMLGSCPGCSTYVFNILGGNQQEFYKYLARSPRLFDGTRSNAPANVLCGPGFLNWLFCGKGDETVALFLAGPPKSDAAHRRRVTLERAP